MAKKRKILTVMVCVAMFATVLAAAVHASESVIFDDQFDDPTLGPEWVISPGKGWYSLTDNPGYLRYIIDAYGWGGGAIPLQLIRLFSGDQWVLTTAITYNMRPAAPTNNRNMHFFIRTPGATGATMIFTYRTAGAYDGNPYSNAMILYADDNSIPIVLPNSPNPLPLDRWYFEIERNKDYIALRASNDGDDSTFEYEVEYTFPPGVLGNDQEIVIQATGWYGSNDPPGYADFDFIRAIAIEPDSLTPPEDFNPVGTEHEVTATVTPAVADVEVWFEVTGANTASGSDLTNASGEASFTYTGTNAGKDVIRAYFDTDGSGHWDEGEPTTDTVDKYWLENFVTGGGKINGSKKVEWSFAGTVGVMADSSIVGQFQIVDHTGKRAEAWHCNNNFSFLNFYGAPVESPPGPPASHDTAIFEGTFTSNRGNSATVRIFIKDSAEPGAGADAISVNIDGGTWEIGGPNFDDAEVINGGNFQVHDYE